MVHGDRGVRKDLKEEESRLVLVLATFLRPHPHIGQ
jgi:hypothetical protein